MRVTILTMCGLVTAGVLATMLLALYGGRQAPEREPRFRQSLATEIVWTMIPVLMVLAATIPAAVAVIAGRATN